MKANIDKKIPTENEHQFELFSPDYDETVQETTIFDFLEEQLPWNK